LGLILAAVSLIGYFSLRQENPFTGAVQHISLNTDQEVALGIQMAPQMAQDMGGLDPDPDAQALVTTVGERVVRQGGAGRTPYEFRFYALADPKTVNAFALPGGPVFITRALLSRLESEAQLAGVLAHEVGHVVARHSAERIAQSELAQGLVGAVSVGGSDDQGSGQQAAQMAAAVAQMVQLRYGRKDEIQSDTLGVRMMAGAGYDPRALIDVMRILEAASGGSGQPEFMSSHPDPGNRRQIITAAIERLYPGGAVPASLTLGRRFAPDRTTSQWRDDTIVALGNEPFWNVRVTANEILYTVPERLDGYRFPVVDAVEEGNARVYRTRRDVPSGEPGPRTLELRIRAGTCSDGMSDRVYPMTAALTIGDQTHTGCAWFQGDTLSTER